MVAELRERIIHHLATHSIAVISATGPDGATAMPVRYRSRGLRLACLLPRWADIAYYAEPPARVVLVIGGADGAPGWPTPASPNRWRAAGRN